MAESAIKATPDMCAFCFDTIIGHFKNKKVTAPSSYDTISWFEPPLFVTWNKKGDLRGCIGTFHASRLSSNLSRFAYISAFEDDRFSPMKESEVKDLEVEVSLLHSFEDCKKWDDWEVGKHGIEVSYRDGFYPVNATYLPDVMVEQKWNQEEAVASCLEKGGYFGKFTEEVKKKVKVVRYQSSVCKLSYDDYMKMKS